MKAIKNRIDEVKIKLGYLQFLFIISIIKFKNAAKIIKTVLSIVDAKIVNDVASQNTHQSKPITAIDVGCFFLALILLVFVSNFFSFI